MDERDELLRSVLAKAQRPGSLLGCGQNSGRWYWLWSTEGGGIGHEDVDPRLLPYLTAEEARP